MRKLQDRMHKIRDKEKKKIFLGLFWTFLDIFLDIFLDFFWTFFLNFFWTFFGPFLDFFRLFFIVVFASLCLADFFDVFCKLFCS